MKRPNFNAFTLAEMFLILIIISVITVVSMRAIKIKQGQFRDLSYIAYNTLLQATGNAYLDWKPDTQCTQCDNDSYCWTENCWNFYTGNNSEQEEAYARGGIPGFPRQYPGFLFGRAEGGNFSGIGTDQAFCKTLTKNINTIDKDIECQSFISGIRPNVNLSIGHNFLSTFCALKEVRDENDNVIDNQAECSGTGNIVPSFIGANGMKFYISSVLTANPPAYSLQDKLNERMMFRLVVVDLNGDNGPNSQFKKNDIYPDLVLFAIKPDASVIPLGILEYSTNYLNAIVQYPEFLNQKDPLANRYLKNTLTQSDPMSLFDAKLTAYAGHASSEVTTQYYGQSLMHTHPFSFSPFLYMLATNCPENGCNNTTLLQNSVYAEKLLVNLVKQFIYDQEGSNSTMIRTEIDSLLDETHGCTENGLRCKINFIKN